MHAMVLYKLGVNGNDMDTGIVIRDHSGTAIAYSHDGFRYNWGSYFISESTLSLTY